jgi:hypothetical protein
VENSYLQGLEKLYWGSEPLAVPTFGKEKYCRVCRFVEA